MSRMTDAEFERTINGRDFDALHYEARRARGGFGENQLKVITQ